MKHDSIIRKKGWGGACVGVRRVNKPDVKRSCVLEREVCVFVWLGDCMNSE